MGVWGGAGGCGGCGGAVAGSGERPSPPPDPVFQVFLSFFTVFEFVRWFSLFFYMVFRGFPWIFQNTLMDSNLSSKGFTQMFMDLP